MCRLVAGTLAALRTVGQACTAPGRYAIFGRYWWASGHTDVMPGFAPARKEGVELCGAALYRMGVLFQYEPAIGELAMAKQRLVNDKDVSHIKRVLGIHDTCSSCHYLKVMQQREPPHRETWSCVKHAKPVTYDYWCLDYQQYAGHREWAG
jgi:hypothetical protein